jgi:hypothetical protein
MVSHEIQESKKMQIGIDSHRSGHPTRLLGLPSALSSA